MGNDKIFITIEQGGEQVRTEINAGDTVQALFDKGHLRGASVNGATLVNGASVPASTPLRMNDTVASVPTSGRQG